MKTPRFEDQPTGKAIDPSGGPVIDPTANVIALVEANAKSSAMLRDADTKFNDAQYSHLKEIGHLRSSNAEILRTSDLDRQEKTRQVDVLAAAASAAALATAVQTLAASTDRNAETIRNQLNADRAALAKLVADTALNVGTQNDSLFKDVNSRIAELQKSSYQGSGKSSVAEPAMAEFVMEMKRMASGIYERTGKESVSDPALTVALAGLAASQAATAAALSKLSTGASEAIGQARGADNTLKMIIAALGVVVTLMVIYTFTQRSSAPDPMLTTILQELKAEKPSAPQIVVVPAGTTLPSAVQSGPPTQVVK